MTSNIKLCCYTNDKMKQSAKKQTKKQIKTICIGTFQFYSSQKIANTLKGLHNNTNLSRKLYCALTFSFISGFGATIQKLTFNLNQHNMRIHSHRRKQHLASFHVGPTRLCSTFGCQLECSFIKEICSWW